MSDPVTRLNAALEGRYRIERELGEGGIATVYLADDLKHERKASSRGKRNHPLFRTQLVHDGGGPLPVAPPSWKDPALFRLGLPLVLRRGLGPPLRKIRSIVRFICQ